MEVKKCGRCKEEKLLSEFNKDKRKKIGLRSNCCECQATDSKKYYEGNKEAVKKKTKEYGAVKHTCDVCGGSYSKNNTGRHIKSKKHQSKL